MVQYTSNLRYQMYSVLDIEIYILDPNTFHIWYLSYFHLK